MGSCTSKSHKTAQATHNNHHQPPTNLNKDAECGTQGSQTQGQKQDIFEMAGEMSGSRILRLSNHEGKASEVSLQNRRTFSPQNLNDGSIEEENYEPSIDEFYHSNIAMEFMIPKAQAGPIFVPVVPYLEICRI